MGTETEGLRFSMINWCQGHTAESDSTGNQCLSVCTGSYMYANTPTLKLNFITHKKIKYVYIHKKLLPLILYFIFM